MSRIDLNKLRKGSIKWCAVSRDLEGMMPMGTVIHIEGHGTYVVHDRMNRRWKHRIDILIHPQDNTKIYRENVKVTC